MHFQTFKKNDRILLPMLVALLALVVPCPAVSWLPASRLSLQVSFRLESSAVLRLSVHDRVDSELLRSLLCLLREESFELSALWF